MMKSEDPRRVRGPGDVETCVREFPPAGQPGRLATQVRQRIRLAQPVGNGGVQVNHHRDLHGDHPLELGIRHLDGVLDPVAERVRPGRAERRLEGIEDHLLSLGAHGMDRDLPPGLVRRGDGAVQLIRLPQEVQLGTVVEMDLQALDAEPVGNRARFAVGVPVAEMGTADRRLVQGEVGVHPQREGLIGGQALQLGEPLRVDPQLGDRGPAALEGRLHGFGSRIQAVVPAVPDPVGVGVDEAGVRDVLTDVDDRHLVTRERQHLVPGADRGHRSVLDEEGVGDGRLVHGHDPAEDDE
ncbi:MAG: hypothetical protein WD402_02100 [Chloroflexota bacterium]